MKVLYLQSNNAGPAHLINNPAPRPYLYLALINLFIATLSLIALFYGNYVNTTSVSSLSYYLLVLAVISWYSSKFFWQVSSLKELSVDEWVVAITNGIQLNILQAFVMGWGTLLCFKVVEYEHLIGTSMYYYILVGKWMTQTILGLSILNSICIISSFYIVLIVTLIHVLNQLFKKRYIH